MSSITYYNPEETECQDWLAQGYMFRTEVPDLKPWLDLSPFGEYVVDIQNRILNGKYKTHILTKTLDFFDRTAILKCSCRLVGDKESLEKNLAEKLQHPHFCKPQKTLWNMIWKTGSVRSHQKLFIHFLKCKILSKISLALEELWKLLAL